MSNYASITAAPSAANPLAGAPVTREETDMSEPRRPIPPSEPIDDLVPDPADFVEPPFVQNGAPPVEDRPDPFDIESLRLPQDFSALLGLQSALPPVEVRSPSREWWIRVHTNAAYHSPPPLIQLKDSGNRGECYLVMPPLWPRLKEEST